MAQQGFFLRWRGGGGKKTQMGVEKAVRACLITCLCVSTDICFRRKLRISFMKVKAEIFHLAQPQHYANKTSGKG